MAPCGVLEIRRKKVEKMEKWAVITGASSGLGVEFAKQMTKRGYKLILTA